MSKWDRWAASTGIVFVALFVAGFFVAGKPPSLSDGNAKWVEFFHDHSKAVKGSSMLFGLAIIAFLWFAAALAARLRDSGEHRLGATVLGGAAATAGTFLVAAGIQASLAYRIAPESPAQVKAFVDLFYTIGILVGFSVGIVIGATSIAALRSGVFPRWFGFAGAVVAVAVVVSGGALAHDGFYSPDGGYALIATAASLVWALVASVLLVRTKTEGTAAA
jgi:hypothetical protein